MPGRPDCKCGRCARRWRAGRDVLDEFKRRMIQQRTDIVERAGEQVVDAEDAVALLNEPVAQMRANKSGAASNNNVELRRAMHLQLLYSIRLTISTGLTKSPRQFRLCAFPP